MMNLLSDRELQNLTTKEKIRYFGELKEQCLDIKKKTPKGTQLARNFVRTIYPPIVRRYEYEVIGKEYVPENGKAIFVCNHSNSHDFFTPLEVMHNYFGLEPSLYVAKDDLNLSTQGIFAACNAVLIDRNDKASTQRGIFELCSKIMLSDSVPGWMYAESTWNIHPFRLMQKLKKGAALESAITGYPIIPTIIEYVEVKNPVDRESKLYEKCIVKFSYPMYIRPLESLISQTEELQRIMTASRANLRRKLGIEKYSLRDVDPYTYVNHTCLKKFDGFGFKYDSQSEQKFLLSTDGKPVDNEYRINEHGILVPGITTEEESKRFIMNKIGR